MITVQAIADISKKIVSEPSYGHSPVVVNPWESEARYPRFLRQVMIEFGLKIAVECGVDLAISTEYMILSHPDSFVIGIDWELRMDIIGRVYERHPHNVIF